MFTSTGCAEAGNPEGKSEVSDIGTGRRGYETRPLTVAIGMGRMKYAGEELVGSGGRRGGRGEKVLLAL